MILTKLFSPAFPPKTKMRIGDEKWQTVVVDDALNNVEGDIVSVRLVASAIGGETVSLAVITTKYNYEFMSKDKGSKVGVVKFFDPGNVKLDFKSYLILTNEDWASLEILIDRHGSVNIRGVTKEEITGRVSVQKDGMFIYDFEGKMVGAAVGPGAPKGARKEYGVK